MDVQYEKTGPCNCKLSITVPAADVDQALKTAYRKVAKSANIPGFRPGKAPRHVLEAHYGDQVRSDVESELVRKSLSQAIVDNEVAPVATPRVEAGELKSGVDFSYTAEVETQPEIELQGYEGLEVPDLTATVADHEIHVELQKLREQSVQLVPVLDRDVVQEGDLVLVDYEGTQGGVPMQGAKANGTILEIGGDEFLPGVSAALIGAAVPSSRSVPIDFPDNHPIEAWRGKGATFQIDIKELKKRDLPNLDDEFAKDLGQENLDAVRDKIRAGLLDAKTRGVESDKRRALLEGLIAKNPFEIPKSMVAEQVDRMIVEAGQTVRRMMGPSFDMKDLDIEGLRQRNQPQAEFQVRSGLLLLEVAKAAKVEVTDEEVGAEIGRQTSLAGDQAERLKAMYGGPEERTRLRYKLLEDKTIQMLFDNAETIPAEKYQAPQLAVAASESDSPAESDAATSETNG